METTKEAVNNCASELANLIAQGVAMQEAENEEIEVMREVKGTEIRDIIWVKGRTNSQSFTTSRKDRKGKRERREVSSLPLGTKGKKPPGISLPSMTEYEDEELNDEFGKIWNVDEKHPGKPPDQVTSWGAGQLEARVRYEETGMEAKDLELDEERKPK